MPTGIGIDVIEIARVERALERRPRLREHLFTAAELAGDREISVSLTHSRETAAAVALAQPSH